MMRSGNLRSPRTIRGTECAPAPVQADRKGGDRVHRPGSLITFAIVLALASLVVGLPTEADPKSPPSGSAPENQVKAAFLYNFARLIDWPADSSARKDGSFRIAVLGDDALALALARVVEGKDVDGMPLVVERVYNASDVGECHILFVAASQDRFLEEVFDTLGDRPVLTVGETDRFARLAGMIRFEIIDGRLRFEVNLDAAQEPGLSISSRLLGVASAVNGKGLGKG